MTLWARPADEGWPELRWLAHMEADERDVLLGGARPDGARCRSPLL
jgi:hypothetical protein